MTSKQRIMISAAVIFLMALFGFIIFNEQGLVDLGQLKEDKQFLMQNNAQLARENLSLSVEIDRLENDPKYIENVARRELGMIGKDEFILKPKGSPK